MRLSISLSAKGMVNVDLIITFLVFYGTLKFGVWCGAAAMGLAIAHNIVARFHLNKMGEET